MVQNHEFADTTEDNKLATFTITSASRTKISGSENIQEGRWLAPDALLTAHN
ncbi:hypothetical protein SALWKB12_2110 [Snodgrassella communis]|nr:hypothetical protein SALWKB12_2110 [Snodgrassella communis]